MWALLQSFVAAMSSSKFWIKTDLPLPVVPAISVCGAWT
jgi:hypothetical protein